MAVIVACGGDGVEADPGGSGVTTRVPTQPPRDEGPIAATPSASLLSWAEAFCAATVQFDAVIAGQDDGVDPRSLDLEARRDRGVQRYEAYVDGLDAVGAELRALQAPADAERYQQATIEQAEALVALLAEEIEHLRTAESHEAIDARLDDVLATADRLGRDVRVEAQGLPSTTARALLLAPRCGVTLG